MPVTFRWARLTALVVAAGVASWLVASLVTRADWEGLAPALLNEAPIVITSLALLLVATAGPIVAAAILARTLPGLLVATVGSAVVSVAWFPPLLSSDSSTAGVGIAFGLPLPGGAVAAVLGAEALWLAHFHPRSPWSDWGEPPPQ